MKPKFGGSNTTLSKSAKSFARQPMAQTAKATPCRVKSKNKKDMNSKLSQMYPSVMKKYLNFKVMSTGIISAHRELKTLPNLKPMDELKSLLDNSFEVEQDNLNTDIIDNSS